MINHALTSLWVRLDTLRNDEGQGMVEYALILVLVSIAAILTLDAIGGTVDVVFTDTEEALSGAPAAPAE